jgi:hypothetical protein
MGCAEERSPFAGSLRESLRYKFYPLPGQVGRKGVRSDDALLIETLPDLIGGGDGRKGVSATC